MFTSQHARSLLTATLFSLASTALVADDPSSTEPEFPIESEFPEVSPDQEIPWFTGPLLTPSGHVVPTGHFNIEPYLYGATDFGVYNQHWKTQSTPNFYSALVQVPIQFGLPGPFDIQFVPQWSWNHTHGASSWALGDLPVGLDVQLLNESEEGWWPAIKLQLYTNLPIGKYQKLNAHKKLTNADGSGSWLPAVGIVFAHLYHFTGVHFLNVRFNASYTWPTPVHVRGLNVYGGGRHTCGKVFPSQELDVLLGLEYSLTQRWVLAFDAQYAHFNRTRFKGQKGKTDGVPNVVGGPSSEQFGIAPAIEYNWSAYIGIIAGCWFSVAGRNASEFATGIVAFNVYH